LPPESWTFYSAAGCTLSKSTTTSRFTCDIMRFSILLATFLLFAFASGLVIPPAVSERDANLDARRQLLSEDFNELHAREPNIFNMVKGAVGAIKGVAGAAKGIIGTVKNVVGKVKNVVNKVRGVTDKVKGVTDNVRGATNNVKGVVNNVKGIAGDVKGAANAIKNARNKPPAQAPAPAKPAVAAVGRKPVQPAPRKSVHKASGSAKAAHKGGKAGSRGNTQKKKTHVKSSSGKARVSKSSSRKTKGRR